MSWRGSALVVAFAIVQPGMGAAPNETPRSERDSPADIDQADGHRRVPRSSLVAWQQIAPAASTIPRPAEATEHRRKAEAPLCLSGARTATDRAA